MQVLRDLNRSGLSIRLACLAAASILLLAGSADAADVAIDCATAGPNAIQNALNGLDAFGPHTITVTGACSEQLNIRDRQRLTLQAPPGQTATIAPVRIGNSRSIVLRRLIITGGINIGLFVVDDAEVRVENCTIQNNGRFGIRVRGSTLNLFRSTVRNHSASGIFLIGSTLGAEESAVENNGNEGIILFSKSRAAIFFGEVRGHQRAGVSVRPGGFLEVSGLTVQNNGGIGIGIGPGATAVISGGELDDGTLVPTVIEGHSLSGIEMIGSSLRLLGPSKIRNNGSTADPFSAGILLFSNGTLFAGFGGVIEISNNTGAGINAVGGGVLDLNGQLAISNNSGDGIRLSRMSVGGFFQNPAFPFAIAGNGGNAVRCDGSSLVYGDLDGIAEVQCRREPGFGFEPSSGGGRSRRELEDEPRDKDRNKDDD